MTDSNFINTEVPADLPEEQEPQLNAKVRATSARAKAKPQRRELVEVPSTIPMSERMWIDIESGVSSISAYEVSKKVINILWHSQKVQREDDGAVQFLENEGFYSGSISKDSFLVRQSLDSMLDSRRKSKREDICIELILQRELSISELFKDIQGAISLILLYRTM